MTIGRSQALKDLKPCVDVFMSRKNPVHHFDEFFNFFSVSANAKTVFGHASSWILSAVTIVGQCTMIVFIKFLFQSHPEDLKIVMDARLEWAIDRDDLCRID